MMEWVRCLAILLLVCGGAARADEASDARARELFKTGSTHYDLGDYDEAIKDFTESYRLSRAPLLLFNIGQAHRLKGDCVQAMRFYKRYLEVEPNPANAEELERAMGRCATQETPPPEARPPAASPPPAAAPPAAVAGPAEPPPAPDAGRGKRLAGLAIAGAGLAAVGTGVYFGLRASAQSDQVEGGSGSWDPGLEAEGERDELVARILWGAGGAAVIGGGIVWWLGHRAGETGAVALTPGRGGATLVWSCAF
jgi:tetratricopeptide (TPR) repeat protein